MGVTPLARTAWHGRETVTQSSTSLETTPYWAHLALHEMLRFYEDYETHVREGEAKPHDIGAPFFHHNPKADTGILLIHGFLSAPKQLREWADALSVQGYTVYAMRLAGHGTSPEDLKGCTHEEWMGDVDRAHRILEGCCKKVIVAGFSMGAGLALAQALAKPNAFQAVISVSAPLKLKKRASSGAEALDDWNRLCRAIGLRWFAKEFVSNPTSTPDTNYLKCPIAGVVQVKALMKSVWRGLPSLAIPALIIQGKGDPTINDTSGKKIFRRIAHPCKTYREIPFHLHDIVQGPIAQELFAEVTAFIASLETPPCIKA